MSNDGSHIESIGEPLPFDVNRKQIQAPEGSFAVWPLKTDNSEGCWQMSPTSLKKAIDNGYVRLGRFTERGIAISYLNRKEIEKVHSDGVEIIGRRPDNSIITNDSGFILKIIPGTQWRIKNHNARVGGTNLLKSIKIDDRFSYPKSLYAVHDVLRFFVANKPNAIILDFFAGSGTTLHAVNLLNKEDGGHRQCIMITNNEVSAQEEVDFRKKGLHKGDEEWEKFGIARYVNWPRTKCSIEGVDVNGHPIDGEYITSNTQEKTLKRTVKQLSFDIPEGKIGEKIKKQIVALINDKNMPQNSVTGECPYIVKEDASTAILFEIECIDDFFEEVHDDIEKIYVVTTDDKAFKTAKKVLDELPERTKSVPVTIPMSDGFEANSVFYKLTFLDKEAVSLGTQLDKLLSILWMKAGAHGLCPTHVEGEYEVFPENKMAILIDEFAFDEMKEKLEQYPEIETVYIIDDSADNYRALASQLKVKTTYQLYRDYLDNFKINIERR